MQIQWRQFSWNQRKRQMILFLKSNICFKPAKDFWEAKYWQSIARFESYKHLCPKGTLCADFLFNFSNRMCRDSSEISYAPSAQEKWSKYNHRSFVLQNKFRGLWEIIKLALAAKIEYLRGTPESRYFQVPSHWNRTLGLKLEMTNGEPIKKKHCQVKQLYKFHHESNKTITIVQACLITFLSIHIMLFVAVSMDGYLVFPCKGL
jgi:hypothetical protein